MSTHTTRRARGFALLAGVTLTLGVAACGTDATSDPAPAAAPQSTERLVGDQADVEDVAMGGAIGAPGGSPSGKPAGGGWGGGAPAPAPQPTPPGAGVAPPPISIPDDIPPGVGYPPEGPDCQLNPQAQAIYDNIWQLPAAPTPGGLWEYKGNSNYSPCLELSYAEVEQMPQGDGQYPTQLMLFHQGRFLGVGTTSVQHGHVVRHDGKSVTVSYTDFEAMERDGAAFAVADQYQVQVTYRWDAAQQRVIPEGRIPNLG